MEKSEDPKQKVEVEATWRLVFLGTGPGPLLGWFFGKNEAIPRFMPRHYFRFEAFSIHIRCQLQESCFWFSTGKVWPAPTETHDSTWLNMTQPKRSHEDVADHIPQKLWSARLPWSVSRPGFRTTHALGCKARLGVGCTGPRMLHWRLGLC